MLKKRALARSRETVTLPDERYRAVAAAERFMRDLCDPRATPRVHSTIRDRARSVLRHYPNSLDLQQLELAAPHVLQQRMEPLHRMVAAWDPNSIQPMESKD